MPYLIFLRTWINGEIIDYQAANTLQQNSPPSEDEVVDIEVLIKLKGIMGAHFDELIPAFIEGVETYFSELKSMNTENNMQYIQRFAHSIKSSSANVGANTLATKCALLEEKASSNTLSDEDMQTRLNEIKENYYQVKQILLDWQINP